MYVRWDAAARTDRLGPHRPHRPHRPPQQTVLPAPATAPATAPHAGVEVSVWLFGALGDPRQPRPLRMHCPSPCRLGDVLDELGRRMGAAFLRQVANRSGAWLETCRVSLDGVLATDLATPVGAGEAPASVEIILFREIEGG